MYIYIYDDATAQVVPAYYVLFTTFALLGGAIYPTCLRANREHLKQSFQDFHLATRS